MDGVTTWMGYHVGRLLRGWVTTKMGYRVDGFPGGWVTVWMGYLVGGIAVWVGLPLAWVAVLFGLLFSVSKVELVSVGKPSGTLCGKQESLQG